MTSSRINISTALASSGFPYLTPTKIKMKRKDKTEINDISRVEARPPVPQHRLPLRSVDPHVRVGQQAASSDCRAETNCEADDKHDGVGPPVHEPVVLEFLKIEGLAWALLKAALCERIHATAVGKRGEAS